MGGVPANAQRLLKSCLEKAEGPNVRTFIQHLAPSQLRRHVRPVPGIWVVDSMAFTDGVHTHTFEDARDLMDEVFWARIYAGFHFHHSLEDGRALGEAVSQGLVRDQFRLQRSHERH
jgi:hypothetical protein